MSKKIRDTTSRLRARAGWYNVLIGESNVAIVPAIGRYGVEDIYLGDVSPHGPTPGLPALAFFGGGALRPPFLVRPLGDNRAKNKLLELCIQVACYYSPPSFPAMHVDEVCRALCATVSPDLTQRCDAETYLNNCRQTVGFPLLLLQLVLAASVWDTLKHKI